MSPKPTIITSLLLASFSVAEAFATTITTDWTTRTTYTTLGYTFTNVVVPTSVVTPISRTDTVTCPQGYGTISNNICIIPASDFPSAKPSTTEPPLVITTTLPVELPHPTLVNGTIITTTAALVVTATDSSIYCPSPYTYYGDGCYKASEVPSLVAAQSTGTLYIVAPGNMSTTATTAGATATTTTSRTASGPPAASTVALNPGNAAGRVRAGNGVVVAVVGLFAIAGGMVLVL